MAPAFGQRALLPTVGAFFSALRAIKTLPASAAHRLATSNRPPTVNANPLGVAYAEICSLAFRSGVRVFAAGPALGAGARAVFERQVAAAADEERSKSNQPFHWFFSLVRA